MILWLDGAHDPETNMRRDARLLEACAAGGPAVMRLFRFEPHGITLGASQRPEAELDLGRCRREQIPWALRPTGGRAIFHAEEWTYALAAPLGDPEWGGPSGEAYARISDLVLRSLIRLGVPARLSPGARGGRFGPRAARGASPPCFASTARSEIVLEGGKLVGSAQRRTARALLQQGSVLLGPGHARLADYAAVDEAARAALRAALERAAAHASPWLGAAPPLERWFESLAAELPPDTRRVRGEDGAVLLTPSEAASYTASATGRRSVESGD